MDGSCNFATQTLTVKNTLSGVEKLETVIHEFLHAALPDLNDDDPGPVYTTAHDLAIFLTRLGYSLDKPVA